MPHNIGTDCRVSIDRAGRYIEAVPLFWLNYRHPDGRFAVVAVAEAAALIQARMQAAVHDLDQRPLRHFLVEILRNAFEHTRIRQGERSIRLREHSQPPQPRQRLVGVHERETEGVCDVLL